MQTASGESKKCPACGLWNSSSAQRCDCGLDFSTHTKIQSTPDGPVIIPYLPNESSISSEPERDHLKELLDPPVNFFNPAFIITACACLLGWTGYQLHIDWLFRLGILLSTIVLFLNIATGVLRGTSLPFIFIIGGMLYFHSWILGGALGLLAWTTLDAAGSFLGVAIWKRRLQ